MDNYRNISALVTGASGFIGSHLVEELCKRGFHVRCLLRKNSSVKWLEKLNIEIFYGDISNTKILSRAIQNVDYVFHGAGIVKAIQKSDFYKYNTEATFQLALEATKHNKNIKRFVYISSQAAAGPSDSIQQPKTEIQEPCPISSYGKSKLFAEQKLKKFYDKIPITIIRPSAVYGPRETELLQYFSSINRGIQFLPGKNKKYVNLIYVKDLVNGIISAAESQATISKTYFLTNDSILLWQDIGNAIKTVLKKRAVKIYLPFIFLNCIAWLCEKQAVIRNRPSQFTREKISEIAQSYWLCSTKSAQRDFGFLCYYDLKKGVEETAAWYFTQKIRR